MNFQTSSQRRNWLYTTEKLVTFFLAPYACLLTLPGSHRLTAQFSCSWPSGKETDSAALTS